MTKNTLSDKLSTHWIIHAVETSGTLTYATGGRLLGPADPLFTKSLCNTYNTFKHIIISQKRLLQYNGDYIAFLLKQTSEEEFENISEQYAEHQNKCTNIDIQECIRITIENFPDVFDAADIADLFNCDLNDAVQHMTSAPTPITESLTPEQSPKTNTQDILTTTKQSFWKIAL